MEMMGGSAQSAVDSLLGRLSSVLVEEAQLLRGVHDDVQFIKREMESMNGFLLDASESGRPSSNQVRAWTRQVHELAFDSQCCLDRYVQTFGAGGGASAGLLATFRQVPKLVRTVSDRHRIATQIRELKARALEVGDRCARYGVATAARGAGGGDAVAAPAVTSGDVARQEADDARRRRALAGAADLFNTDVRAEELLGWLRGKPVRRNRRRHLRNQFVTVHHLMKALLTGGDDGSLDDLKMEFLKLVMELLHHDNPGNVAEAYGYLNEIMKEVAMEEVKVLTSNIIDWFLPTEDKPSSQQAGNKKTSAAAAADLLEMVKEATEPMEIARAEARYVGAQLLWLIQVFFHKFIDEITHEGHGPKVLAIVTPPPPSSDDDHHAAEAHLSSSEDPLTHSTELARKVYEDPIAADHFKIRVWVDARSNPKAEQRLRVILQEVLRQEQLHSFADEVATGSKWDDNSKVKEELQKHLNGKLFLIVLADPEDEESWWDITSALPNHGDSAVVVTPYIHHTAQFHAWHTASWFFLLTGNSSRYEVHFCTNLVALRKVAAQLSSAEHLQDTIYGILKKCHWDSFATMMFLNALYANPRRSKGELEKLLLSLRHSSRVGNARSMIIFSLEDLPSQYQRCLLCLYVFPQDAKLKRTSLLRRWAAESFVTGRDGQMSAADEAERCFDALIARGLLLPAEVGPAGKVKTCTVHPLVFTLITKMASDVNDIDGGGSSDQPPDLAHRLSTPRTGVRLLLQQEKQATTTAQGSISTCWGVLHRHRATAASKAKVGLFEKQQQQQLDVVTFLNLLPASSSDQLGLIKVLDLEGCRGLKKQRLKKICDKIFQLRYLSLRDTDATELPKEIDKLRYLEMLDIRKTKITSFPAKTIALPKLIHLLAGQYTPRTEEHGDKSFSTVHLPRGIRSMTSMQVLSHVEVSQLSDEEELSNIGRKLQQLRKLGVVIRDDDAEAHLLKVVLRVVGKLHECLCSLSIHVEPASVPNKKHHATADQGDGDSRSSSKEGGVVVAAEDPGRAADLNTDEVRQAPPTSLASLRIKGKIRGLPAWIKRLPRLLKVTLWCTYLKESDVRLLGELVNLRCVRLWANSYKQKNLTLMGKEFRRLEVLVVEGSDITSIYFDHDAAPKLEKIAWTSTGADQVALFGIDNLLNLTEVELNGECEPSKMERMKQDMKAIPNSPKLTGTALDSATVAPSSSACGSNISPPK
uniref:Rx N-terminal domain-containing protein n=1 Tax=Oryza punctata TaxID=4537 RepID=A0A0E0MHN0_ORYPU